MKPDERIPLSTKALKNRLLQDSRMKIVAFLPVTICLTLFAVILTAVALSCPQDAQVFFIVLAVLCWIAVGVQIYVSIRKYLRYRADLQQSRLCIVEDEVRVITEELDHKGRNRIRVMYLVNHGRCPVSESFCAITEEGDKVYVAVIQRERPKVVGVYSTLTHRIVGRCI